MRKKKAKEILNFIVSICGIISCVATVYGVFQVVEFVVDVRPIVVPIAKEVKKGKVDVRKMLTGMTIHYDTVRVIKRDTIYIHMDKTGDERDLSKRRKLTEEEELCLDKSRNNVSEQEREKINEAESSFRQRMKEKMR